MVSLVCLCFALEMYISKHPQGQQHPNIWHLSHSSEGGFLLGCFAVSSGQAQCSRLTKLTEALLGLVIILFLFHFHQLSVVNKLLKDFNKNFHLHPLGWFPPWCKRFCWNKRYHLMAIERKEFHSALCYIHLNFPWNGHAWNSRKLVLTISVLNFRVDGWQN